ncbi:MAG: hypothetical protein MJE77_16200, partial [Proteobacteria bacterium]|nr:hypothetical protein [Pseudomonadota bacterium]
IGPGALYLEQGTNFSPPLPAAARARAFEPFEGDSVVVLMNDRGFRFDATGLVPAWTLWAGNGPDIESSDVPASKARRIRELAGMFTRRRTLRGQGAAQPAGSDSELDAIVLREQAAAAIVRGDLSTAASKFEAAGDTEQAAMYYELAAIEIA